MCRCRKQTGEQVFGGERRLECNLYEAEASKRHGRFADSVCPVESGQGNVVNTAGFFAPSDLASDTVCGHGISGIAGARNCSAWMAQIR